MASQANKGGCPRVGVATVMNIVAESSVMERRDERKEIKKNFGKTKDK